MCNSRRGCGGDGGWPMPDVAIVFGTVNRLALLQACVESIRRAAGSLSCVCLVADGNSTDGSREWLAAQPDCELLEGGRDGAVAAFNVAFSRAVDLGSPFVCQFNDDLAFVDGLELERAAAILRSDPGIGAIAFASDRYSPGVYGFYNMTCLGRNYANQGLFRLEAGMAAARMLGDPTGKAWWDRRFHTYASDTVLGLCLWRLGWTIHEAADIHVRDPYASGDGMRDPLRMANLAAYTNATLFSQEWGHPARVAYSREDAIAYGGRVR